MNNEQKPKILPLVRAEQIYDFLVDQFDQWEFISPISTGTDLHTLLQQVEISEIDGIWMLIDDVFVEQANKPNDPDFTTLITTLAWASYDTPIMISYADGTDVGKSVAEDIRGRIRDGIRQENIAHPSESASIDVPIGLIPWNENIDIGVEDFLSKYTTDNNTTPDGVDKAEALIGIVETGFEDYFEEVDYGKDEELEIPEQKGEGKIITVTSSKGGSGKSSISVLLASYIARASKEDAKNGYRPKDLKVCVVDMDDKDGQLVYMTYKMDAQSSFYYPGVRDIIDSTRGEYSVTREDIEKGIAHNEGLGCDFIYAVSIARNADSIPPQFYINMLTELKTMYDIIVIDTSVRYTDKLLSKVCYPMADYIVCVSDVVVTSLKSTEKWLDEAISPTSPSVTPIPPNKIGVVVNKFFDGVMNSDIISYCIRKGELLAVMPNQSTIITFCTNHIMMEKCLEYEVILLPLQEIADGVLKHLYGENFALTPLQPKILNE